MVALGYRPSLLGTAGAWALAVGSSVLLGAGLSGADATSARLVPLLGGLAALVIALSLPAEWVFFGWLFAAPFLQEGLVGSALGKPLQLVLYQFPPLVFLLWTVMRRGTRRRGSWYDVLPAISLSYIGFALALSPWVGHDAATFRALYFTVGIGVVLYYVAAFGPGRLEPEPAARVLLGSGLVVALFALLQAASAWSPWLDNGWTEAGRAVGPLQNPAALGAFLGAVLVVAIAALAWPVERATHRLATIALLPTGAAIALTYTRAAILAALVMGLLVGLVRFKSRLVTIGIVALAALIVAGSWGKITTTAAYRDRFTNSTNVEARVLIQDWSLQLARQRPLAGFGYGSFDEVKNSANLSSGRLPADFGLDNTSHNTYLTVLVETGLLGLALVLLPLLVIVGRLLQFARGTPRHRWFIVGTIGIVGVYVLNATAIDMRFFSFVPALVWVFVGLGRRAMLAEEG